MVIGIQTKISTQCLYYQSHGRVDTERYQSVLRIRRGETKGSYMYLFMYVHYIYIHAYVRKEISMIYIHIYLS
jgi:hypothetical protein